MLTIGHERARPKIGRPDRQFGRCIMQADRIAGAGDRAARRFLEFFAATIRNKNTRMPITGPVPFLRLGRAASDRELADIEPVL